MDSYTGPYRSGRHTGAQSFSLLAGLAALLWFLARVIPKPSRAAYPCQRAAAPLAGGFLVWIAGLVCLKLLHSRASVLAPRSAVAWAVAAIAAGGLALWLPLGAMEDAVAQPLAAETQHFSPSEGPNAPIGEGIGIHPGRVSWVRDPDSTSWDGANGCWWDDANTNQTVVDRMTARALRDLSGAKSEREAWDALFRHFNRTHSLGNAGYRPGEKIVIKINANQDRSPEWGKSAPASFGPPFRKALNGMPSPHVVYSLVSSLISQGGVPGEDITVFDVCGRRNIGQPIYGRFKSSLDPRMRAVKFLVGMDYGLPGRIAPTPDDRNPIRFSKAGVPPAYLPQQVTSARYMVNVALLRGHGMAGITLTAKNHFGSIYFPSDGGWSPRLLHNMAMRSQPMGAYNPLVDLIGHRHLGGKTVLYMLDGLYSAEHNEGNVIRFASLGDDWASSLLMSQDPVAIDSVGLDILRNEPRATQVRGNADNYVHEAALAAHPPSGTVYDPEGDGKPAASLGVHEHWNNAAARQYSRNLGKKQGIELIAAHSGTVTP
jgi:uncharacterized protein (DUF362 family)